MTSFEWKGIDDGMYKLVETTTPAGYNTIDPIEFNVVAEHVIVAENPSLTSLTGNKATGETEAEGYIPTITVQMSAIVFACLPIICVYPFIQKYFTKGVMLGAIKG